MRVALRFAYDGSTFDSYARQPGRRTVESALVDALAEEGLAPGGFRAGSRTDAGVSALENVALAELDRPHLKGLLPALQRRLPAGLWATGAAVAPTGFDPRKASWREYRYWAPQRGEALGPMREAATAFVGRHGMAAFARVEAHRDPLRTVLSVTVEPDADPALRAWRFAVRGQSFLWGQVRRMVGALLAVGAGEATPDDVARALRTGRPHARFATAPAEGLVLARVHYEGLAWDTEAGGVGWRAVGPAAQAAESRRDVARHVAGLAYPQVSLRSTT